VDIYEALEQRVEALITAYRELQDRVGTLEDENRSLKGGNEEIERLSARIAELESERDEVRGRLEKMVKSLSELEV
jgi:predicted  nucleic acid-binding Zn-ribbon protein